MFLFAQAMLLTVLLVPAAADPVTWYLSGVTLQNGGTATGSFEWSEYNFTDWNITVQSPAGPGVDVFTFTPSNSLAAISFFGPELGYSIQLQFLTQTWPHINELLLELPWRDYTPIFLPQPGPLPLLLGNYCFYYAFTASDVSIQTNITGGQLTTAVPEPSLMVLLGISAMGLVGLKRWWRQ